MCSCHLYNSAPLKCFSFCDARWLLQLLLGAFRLGGFTHFIPSAVIKGMLAAIGIILISKQVPLLIGFNKPDFGQMNCLTLSPSTMASGILMTCMPTRLPGLYYRGWCFCVYWSWNKFMVKKFRFFLCLLLLLFWSVKCVVFQNCFTSLQLNPTQYVTLPPDIFWTGKVA